MTTGFGKLADIVIPLDRIAELQAEVKRHRGGRRDSQEFKNIKARLRRLPAPKAMPRS